MAQTIIMPQLGETVAEGKILEWFKAVGDDVKIGDRLFEVETDKVTVEVEATVAGKLTEIRTMGGATAKVGATVAMIGGDAVAPKPAPFAPTPAPAAPKGFSAFEEVRTPTENFGNAKSPDGLRITPLARRLIAQRGLDVNALARDVVAKGLKRIEEKDVLAFTPMQAATLATAPVQSFGGDVITLNTIRQRTGEKLAENWRTIPHVFQAIDVDFTEIEVVRARHKERFKAETGTSPAPCALHCRPSRSSMRASAATV
jgi:pyruvate/2-oxoglutarate dehydrogenase complex dihydrolipoamide acyltransferase (E2) component